MFSSLDKGCSGTRQNNLELGKIRQARYRHPQCRRVVSRWCHGFRERQCQPGATPLGRTNPTLRSRQKIDRRWRLTKSYRSHSATLRASSDPITPFSLPTLY